MARPERFELPTSWFVARRSIQLSYGRIDQRNDIILAEREGLLGAARLVPSLRFGTAVATRRRLPPQPTDSFGKVRAALPAGAF